MEEESLSTFSFLIERMRKVGVGVQITILNVYSSGSLKEKN